MLTGRGWLMREGNFTLYVGGNRPTTIMESGLSRQDRCSLYILGLYILGLYKVLDHIEVSTESLVNVIFLTGTLISVYSTGNN
jgi:hypothetical protein